MFTAGGQSSCTFQIRSRPTLQGGRRNRLVGHILSTSFGGLDLDRPAGPRKGTATMQSVMYDVSNFCFPSPPDTAAPLAKFTGRARYVFFFISSLQSVDVVLVVCCFLRGVATPSRIPAGSCTLPRAWAQLMRRAEGLSRLRGAACRAPCCTDFYTRKNPKRVTSNLECEFLKARTWSPPYASCVCSSGLQTVRCLF